MKQIFRVVAVSVWLTIGVWNVVQASPILITNSNDVSLAGSTVLDFDSEPDGDFTSRTFSNFVTISSAQNLYVSSNFGGSFGVTGTYIETRENPDPFRIDFAEDVSAFGFNWGAADEPWTMSLFNDSTGFLGSLSIAAQSGSYAGFIGGKDATSSISYAIMTNNSTYGYDHSLIDDFEYVKAETSTPIPEPSTMLLLGGGLAGLALVALPDSCLMYIKLTRYL